MRGGDTWGFAYRTIVAGDGENKSHSGLISRPSIINGWRQTDWFSACFKERALIPSFIFGNPSPPCSARGSKLLALQEIVWVVRAIAGLPGKLSPYVRRSKGR